MEMNDRVKCMHDDINIVDRYCSIIEKSNDINDLKKLCDFVKSIAPDFYDGSINKRYHLIRKSIASAEETFSDQHLLPISFTLKKGKVLKKSSNEYEILDYLVNEARKYLLKRKYGRLCMLHPRMSWDDDFANYCYIASDKIKEMCDFLGITCHLIGIWPGYDKAARLLNDNGYHFCNIVEFDKRYFLIDVTYKQFFRESFANINRIGLMDYALTKAGCFMMMSDFGKDISSKILSDGYIELDPDVFKAYMDGFSISFRNGLYYEETNDFSYTTNYSAIDYVNFLNGHDSQINHEGEEVLGYQKRPIRM